MKITVNEKDTITEFDYQIFNNGIDAIYHNNCYRELFKYLDILAKEGSEISIEVSNIIKRAFILIIELNRFGECVFPVCGLAEEIVSWKKELTRLEEQYYCLSEELLSIFFIKKDKEAIKPSYEY